MATKNMKDTDDGIDNHSRNSALRSQIKRQMPFIAV